MHPTSAQLDQVKSISPATLGELQVWPPVVLAPMAGITNAAFRKLCRRFGAGLYVSEMATARGIVEDWPRSREISHFAPDEDPRSIQLYATDPYWTGRAVEKLVSQSRVDHIDFNFGCPVRKITRKGGGAALPLRRALFREILAEAVRHAGSVPITVKMRLGVDQNLQTFLEAGRIAEGEGVSAIALHARTAAQLYSGKADWARIGELKAAVTSVPVLGNGDIFEAGDALAMIRETGCDGVVIGRGCLGRPWLFRELADLFDGRSPLPAPTLGRVADVMVEHARLLVDLRGEDLAMPEFRKHASWYVLGYAVSPAERQRLCRVQSLHELEDLASGLDPELEVDPNVLKAPRGKAGNPQKVALPEGFLANRDDPMPIGAEPLAAFSGG
ncbi:MAG: tRNA dihydrouridine synthase DusB [Pseudomonadota bacterium]